MVAHRPPDFTRLTEGIEAMPRRFMRPTALAVLGVGISARAETRTIARCGAGFLEEVDGYKVLHVKGTPYEMGYQHGALLRDDIKELVHFLFEVKAKDVTVELAGVKLGPKAVISTIAERQRKFAPARFYDEMRGVADG